MKVLFLLLYPEIGPSSRFRVYFYKEYLEKFGLKITISPFFNNYFYKEIYKRGNYFNKILAVFSGIVKRIIMLSGIGKFDFIMIQREAIPFGSAWYEMLITKLNHRCIFDFDDAIYLVKYNPNNYIMKFFKSPEKVRKIIGACSQVWAGNEYLAEYSRKYSSKVKILPTTVDTSYYIPGKKNDRSKIIIGWIGSVTTAPYLFIIENVLCQIQEKYGNKIEIHIIGGEGFRFNMVKAVYLDWTIDKELLFLQRFNLGLMPLMDTEWERGKCGLKLLQYMSIAIPAIASPVGVNARIINNEVNGFLADHDEEWIHYLSYLIERPDIRKKIGKSARKYVMEHYDTQKWANQIYHWLAEYK